MLINDRLVGGHTTAYNRTHIYNSLKLFGVNVVCVSEAEYLNINLDLLENVVSKEI